MRECNSYKYYLLSYIIMWYKFKMLAIGRGVHPAQKSSSGNPANVGRLETARKTPKTVLIVYQSYTIRFIYSLNQCFAKRWENRKPEKPHKYGIF